MQMLFPISGEGGVSGMAQFATFCYHAMNSRDNNDEKGSRE